MRQDRRQVLRSAGVLAAGIGLAGCTEGESSGDESDEEMAADDSESMDEGGQSEGEMLVPAELAVAAEWTALRAQVDDAEALGRAGFTDAGAHLAGRTLERFETANGEYGAHEFLQRTDTENYANFEGGVESLEEALAEGDVDAAADGGQQAHENLLEATAAVVGEDGAHALDVLRYGAAVNNVAMLTAAGEGDAAAEVAVTLAERWEESAAHDALASADAESYSALEGDGIEPAQAAAEDGDVEAAVAAANSALAAAAAGAASVSGVDGLVQAGHLAGFQARGWDAISLHIVGEPETGATVAEEGLEAFESSTVHDELSASDAEAYSSFEGSVEELADALRNNEGIHEAEVEFADAALTAQFAVVGARDDVPEGSGDGHDHDHEDDHHE